MNVERIIELCRRYYGESELPGNVFTNKTEFGRLLHAAGQEDGQPWCAYAAEVIFKLTYPERYEELDKLFSASATKTYDNFVDAGYEPTMIPEPGALMIMQRQVDGVPQWQGHAGIVIKRINRIEFVSADGNTNKKGEREGTTFMEKLRNTKPVTNGLQVKGFIRI